MSIAVVLPALQTEADSLKGGFWPEGWSYGALSAINIVTAGLAYESAGLGSAGPERQWAAEVLRHLLGAQPTQATVYNGGDWFAYPAPAPGKELFYVLADAAADGRLKPGELVLMTGMGAGLTWGSALIEWTEEMV